jgi:hypothetical protein
VKPATDEQLAELRRIIISADHPYVTDFGKKAMLFALTESKNLTVGIDLVLIEVVKKLASEIKMTVHQLISSGYSTQINEKINDLGLKFVFEIDGLGKSQGCLTLCHRARVFPLSYKDEVGEAEQVEVKIVTVAAPVQKLEAIALELFQEIEKISLKP